MNLDTVRDKTHQILYELHQEIVSRRRIRSDMDINIATPYANQTLPPHSWIHNPTSSQSFSSSSNAVQTETESLTSSPNHHTYTSPSSFQSEFFHTFGFLHIPSFAHLQDEVLPMKEQMYQLVLQSWNVITSDVPSSSPRNKKMEENNEDLHHHQQLYPNSTKEQEEMIPKTYHTKPLAIFRTDDQQLHAIQQGEDYFLSSADSIHFFAEKDTVDELGQLKKEFHSNKMAALNKVGHGLHIVPGPFHDYSTSTKIKDLVYDLGWKDPVIPQSMYIFKQAHVGTEVTSHQDSTFLYTYPRQSCLGLWLALDDATVMNGCLWIRPSSHWESLRRRFIRNIQYFGQDSIQHRRNIPRGDITQSQMLFIQEHPNEHVSWEGTLPVGCMDDPPSYDGLFEAGFIPMECKAGDLIVFPGTLDHLSLPNTSNHPRHTFQLHLVEGPQEGFTWAESNWLQYPPGTSFLSIRKDKKV